MVYGILQLINFAHEVLMIGAMFGLTCVSILNLLFPGLPGSRFINFDELCYFLPYISSFYRTGRI